MLHLTGDTDSSVWDCGRVQRDAAAGAVGAIQIGSRHFGADPGELAQSCQDCAGAVVDEPRHCQFVWVEAYDVTLEGPLLSLCHSCVFWERHPRLSWRKRFSTQTRCSSGHSPIYQVSAKTYYIYFHAMSDLIIVVLRKLLQSH